MAVPNGLNPDFGGRVSALGFEGTHGHGVSVTCVKTNGTTNVNVFGATVGFDGTITGVYMASTTTTNIIVWLKTYKTIATIQSGASSTIKAATTLDSTAKVFDRDSTLVVVTNGVGKNAYVWVTYQVLR